MGRLAVLVQSKGVDLVAVTALETLRGPLGYGDLLSGLARADLWAVSTHPRGAALELLARRLLEETAVFVNPNKHRWELWVEGAGCDVESDGDAWALVWHLDDAEGRGAHAALNSFGFRGQLRRVVKATLWTFRFGEPVAGGEPRIVAEMTATRARRRGLLANPHVSRWACGGGRLSLLEALRLLELDKEEGG